MMDQELENLKYPIGKYKILVEINEEQIKEWISQISGFPSRLTFKAKDLSEVQLNTPYRP